MIIIPPGGTALHLAAENGHIEVIEELLQARANVEVLDTKGERERERERERDKQKKTITHTHIQIPSTY